jgi:hypothetical protein
MSDPEEALARYWMSGRTVEIGAGHNPTPGVDITMDHTLPGQLGTAGCEEGFATKAMVCGDMARLPFADKSFDTLIGRHILEHHVDTLAVLREWGRVTNKMIIVCPDQQRYPGNTVKLDPTHEACFTEWQLVALMQHVGFDTIHVGPATADWSFVLVAKA